MQLYRVIPLQGGDQRPPHRLPSAPTIATGIHLFILWAAAFVGEKYNGLHHLGHFYASFGDDEKAFRCA